MTRKFFTPEFKLAAVKLVTEQGLSVSNACKTTGVGDTALRRWIKQYKDEQQGISPNGKALTIEQQRIQVLEKQVQTLQQEKDLLKKAAAFFVKELDHSSK